MQVADPLGRYVRARACKPCGQLGWQSKPGPAELSDSKGEPRVLIGISEELGSRDSPRGGLKDLPDLWNIKWRTSRAHGGAGVSSDDLAVLLPFHNVYQLREHCGIRSSRNYNHPAQYIPFNATTPSNHKSTPSVAIIHLS